MEEILSLDPIVSWRALEMVQWENRVWFTSGQGTIWPEYQRLESFCRSSMYGQHIARHQPNRPVEFCTCGIYSFKTFPLLVESNYVVHNRTIVARLYNWGRVIETTNGYRSQFVYPKDCIAYAQEQADLITACYGIPCAVANVKGMWEKAKRGALEKARKLAMEKYNTFNPWGFEKRKDDEDIPF